MKKIKRVLMTIALFVLFYIVAFFLIALVREGSSWPTVAGVSAPIAVVFTMIVRL